VWCGLLNVAPGLVVFVEELTHILKLNSNGLAYAVNGNAVRFLPADALEGYGPVGGPAPVTVISAKGETLMTGQSGHSGRLADLRGARYGEILLVRSEEGQLTAAIYNTTGLNDCPAELWRSLDPGKLAEDFGVPMVVLNGPRFWVLDQVTAHATGEILSFSGLEARWVAEVPVPPGQAAEPSARRYYSDVMVKRETEWLFAAGRPVYELVTPDGKIYVMQAYAHIVDDSLTMDALPALGDRLNIPEGWRYRVRIPDQDLALLAVGGQAHVLQDELQNTYMQLMAG